MSASEDSALVARIRATIEAFLHERMMAKLEKIEDDDEKGAEVRSQFASHVWLQDAARRVGQLQLVTHSLKPIHPDARGTSLYCDPETLPDRPELGSHSLGGAFAVDVVGNAAALDVFKFLMLEIDGVSIFDLANQDDPALLAALSDDEQSARASLAAFAGLARPRSDVSSHSLAKQLYWPVGDDPHDDADYHILAPLYPTSLVHRLHQQLQDDRFGDEAKSARAARRSGLWHTAPVHNYPALAVQKLGGTKPQNISQLNSERRGVNYLLASLPPVWNHAMVTPLFGVKSLFVPFQRRARVRQLTRDLKRFLQKDPRASANTRDTRDDQVASLLDELIEFTDEMQQLEPGWSRDRRCALAHAHAAWLDSDAEVPLSGRLIQSLAEDFGRWLNIRLGERLALADAEYLHWRGMARMRFDELVREGAYELA